MSSSKQKDQMCSCEHKLYMNDLDNVSFLKDLPKEYRYEIWTDTDFLCFLEYVDGEDRWFFYRKLVELKVDENNNYSTHMIEFFEGDKNGK